MRLKVWRPVRLDVAFRIQNRHAGGLIAYDIRGFKTEGRSSGHSWHGRSREHVRHLAERTLHDGPASCIWSWIGGGSAYLVQARLSHRNSDDSPAAFPDQSSNTAVTSCFATPSARSATLPHSHTGDCPSAARDSLKSTVIGCGFVFTVPSVLTSCVKRNRLGAGAPTAVATGGVEFVLEPAGIPACFAPC